MVVKETKNKMKADFERTSLKERMKAKYLNSFFYKKLAVAVFRFILLLGISYIILFPFFSKISASFMSPQDFIQSDVKMIPKFPTLNTYKYLIIENQYFKAMLNSFILSGVCALIQMFVAAFVGYGFAKFKFKGRNLVFLFVMLTMIVPHQILASSFVQKFIYFDIFGIFKATGFYNALGLTQGVYNTYVPLILLSLTGLAFKNGLFIFLMRSYYRGVPDELEESSFIDGYGVFRTFFKIILPISGPMLITIFILAFAWQWTDIFYVNTFLPSSENLLLTSNQFWSVMPETLEVLSTGAGATFRRLKLQLRTQQAFS
jgi:multiple sugar transport system permease protein